MSYFRKFAINKVVLVIISCAFVVIVLSDGVNSIMLDGVQIKNKTVISRNFNRRGDKEKSTIYV